MNKTKRGMIWDSMCMYYIKCGVILNVCMIIHLITPIDNMDRYITGGIITLTALLIGEIIFILLGWKD